MRVVSNYRHATGTRLKSTSYLQSFLRLQTKEHACGTCCGCLRAWQFSARISIQENERHTGKQICRDVANTYDEVQIGIRVFFLDPCYLLRLNRGIPEMVSVQVFAKDQNPSWPTIAQGGTDVFVNQLENRPTDVFLHQNQYPFRLIGLSCSDGRQAQGEKNGAGQHGGPT